MLKEVPRSDGVDYQCNDCNGRFTAGTRDVSAAIGAGASAGAQSASQFSCPACLLPMQSSAGRGAHRCARCGGVWLQQDASAATDDTSTKPSTTPPAPSRRPARPDRPQRPKLRTNASSKTTRKKAPTTSPSVFITEEPASPIFEDIESTPLIGAEEIGSFLYALSLPERVVRGTVGLAAGAARDAAAVLVPQAFQDSKSYEIAVKNSLGFLADDIGGMQDKDSDADEASEHMARKMVGNFVEMAGLATLHLSPIWMLAIVSDVAYGSKAFVSELAGELQQQGLIDETSTIHNVDELLDALQNASGETATLFDRPPFNIAELKVSVEKTKQTLTSAEYAGLIPEAEARRYWDEMREIAGREETSLLAVSGALTLGTLEKLQTVSAGTLTGVKLAGELLNRNVIGHYRDTLSRIHEQGYYETLSATATPYIDSVWDNFSTERESWTEKLLKPDNIQGVIDAGWNLLEGDDK